MANFIKTTKLDMANIHKNHKALMFLFSPSFYAKKKRKKKVKIRPKENKTLPLTFKFIVHN
jgi:hypothetical protein